MSKLWDMANGRKIPIFLVIMAISTIAAFAVTNYQVGEHDKMLKPMPAQIAVIEERVQNIDEQFKEFRGDYKEDQRTLDGKLERIWQKVK